jgi:hypothetical protein
VTNAIFIRLNTALLSSLPLARSRWKEPADFSEAVVPDGHRLDAAVSILLRSIALNAGRSSTHFVVRLAGSLAEQRPSESIRRS